MSLVEPIVHTMGGGDDRPLRFKTDGLTRLEISGVEPVVSVAKVVTEPTTLPTAKSSFFFRADTDGKWQFCVKFPSGATQVIVSEP